MTTSRRALREQRHRSYLIVNDLYRSTPWYLLAERSILKAKMRSLRPVSS